MYSLPFPAWTQLPFAPGEGLTRTAFLQLYFGRKQLASLPHLGSSASPERVLLLTDRDAGFQAARLCRMHPSALIDVVDPDGYALGYGHRVLRQLGADNVAFFRGTVDQLGARAALLPGQPAEEPSSEAASKLAPVSVFGIHGKYPYVEALDVMHHHPEGEAAGWQVLSELLSPGGILVVGVNVSARKQQALLRHLAANGKMQGLVGTVGPPQAARAKHAQADRGKTRPVEAGTSLYKVLREPTEDETQQAAAYGLQSLQGTPAPFAFGLSMWYRELTHKRGRLYNGALLEERLKGNGLEMIGVLLWHDDADLRARFRNEFPEDVDMKSLDNWCNFAKQNYNEFGEMLFLCCRKT